MRRPFAGFSTQRARSIPLPVEVFTEVLSAVQDLAELKVLLTVFRRVAAQRDLPKDQPRLVGWGELRQDPVLIEGLSVLGQDLSPEQQLDRALEKAVARGTLLHVVAHRGGHAESWYLVNTTANRKLVEELGEDLTQFLGTPLEEAETARVERPTIFRLYEENIGVITPMLAEELQEAGRQYPPEWIEEAFREAVTHNRRSWRYVQAILERWGREGRGERPARGTRTLDVDKYTSGKYAHLFGRRQRKEHEQDQQADETDQP